MFLFSIIDARGLLIAVIVGAAFVALPGLAVARLLGFSRAGGNADALCGTVVGLAVLPGVASLLTRCFGLDAAFAGMLVMAVAGAGLLITGRTHAPRPSALTVALLAIWFGILLAEWVDYDVAGRLFQPLTVVDTVKHAATTQAILDSGAPPRDAFFLRPERASYYYFFYTIAALIERAGLGLVDARSAVGGLVFWVGVGLYGLVRLAIARAGIELLAEGRRSALLILAVLVIGGLDSVALLYIAVRHGYWMADPMQWNTQISIWSGSVLWVPHHVTALIASTLGLMALSDLVDDRAANKLCVARKVLLAALSFAASLGLSVWVTLALVTTAAAWGLLLLLERQWRAAALLVCSGLVALLLAAPQIADLRAGRSGLPIDISIRSFAPVEAFLPDAGAMQELANLALLPLNLFIEFGALAVGSFIYWRVSMRARVPQTTFGRVLAVAAVSGLFLGSTFQSLLFNNDLGWRVMLFPLLAGTIWTVAALDGMFAKARTLPRPGWRALPFSLQGLIGLGWATSAAVLIGMRAYPLLPVNAAAQYLAADPQTERALRAAYAWADAYLPRTSVLQHNPLRSRAIAFGLYSRNPTALSDRFGSLFGADVRAVQARFDSLGSIYRDVLPQALVRNIAVKGGIDELIVTAADPIWARQDSFVWRAKPAYASERVRIIPVTALGG